MSDSSFKCKCAKCWLIELNLFVDTRGLLAYQRQEAWRSLRAGRRDTSGSGREVFYSTPLRSSAGWLGRSESKKPLAPRVNWMEKKSFFESFSFSQALKISTQYLTPSNSYFTEKSREVPLCSCISLIPDMSTIRKQGVMFAITISKYWF